MGYNYIYMYMHTHICVCSHMYCVVYLDSGTTTHDMILRRQRPGWKFNLKMHIYGQFVKPLKEL